MEHEKTLSRLRLRVTRWLKMVAVAQISNVNFPLRMPGELIVGHVTVKNVGNEATGEVAGFFGVLVKTLWDGQEYPLFMYSITAPGETLTFYYSSLGTMPEGDVVLEIMGITWLGEDRRVDDVKSWDLSEGILIPEPKPLMPLLLLGVLALLLFGRK